MKGQGKNTGEEKQALAFSLFLSDNIARLTGKGTEPMIFDTHAHYDSGAFNADREELLASMPSKGVGLILDPGCEERSSRAALALAEKYSFVYAAVGVHPEDSKRISLPPSSRLRRSSICRSSCMTERRMPTAWRSRGVFRKRAESFTAFPAAPRWRRSCCAAATGISALTVR